MNDEFQYNCILKSSDDSVIRKMESFGLKRSMDCRAQDYIASYNGWIITSRRHLLGGYIECSDVRTFLALTSQRVSSSHPDNLWIVVRPSLGYRIGNLYYNLPLMSNISPGSYRRATLDEIVNFMKKNQDFCLRFEEKA